MLYGMRAYGIEDLETAGSLNLDFVEIQLKETNWILRNLPTLNRLKSRLRLKCLAHGPQEGNPKDLYGIRHEYAPKVKKCLELCQRIGAKALTIHLWFDRRYVDQETLQGKVKVFKDLVEYGEAKKVKVYLENLSEEVEDFVLPFFEVSGAGMTLDIGHGQLMRRQNTCFNFLSHSQERVKHVHVHDNQGGRSPRNDSHLPVGEGIVPIKEIITGLVLGGYDGTMTIEVDKEHLADSLAKVKEMVAKANELKADTFKKK